MIDYKHPRSACSPHSYENISFLQEHYESVVLSRHMGAQTLSISILHHKAQFAYECVCGEALAGRSGAAMATLVGRTTRANFGNVREYGVNNRVLLEPRGPLSALLFHQWPPCPEPGGGSATTIAPLRRARRWALA
jgi:hypothetical protein